VPFVQLKPAERSFIDMARDLVSSLREHGLEVGELEPVCACLFRTEVERRPLIVCVAGLGDMPVDRHCVEGACASRRRAYMPASPSYRR